MKITGENYRQLNYEPMDLPPMNIHDSIFDNEYVFIGMMIIFEVCMFLLGFLYAKF